MNQKQLIESGNTILGCELGSTRIKATLISPEGKPLASGAYNWENKLQDGIWTYALDDVWKGIAGCFENLQEEVEPTYGTPINSFAAVGFSGMMHGYLPFDAHGNLLVPFRTWRNNITGDASKELTELFAAPIPQRWSIAHLFQAILNGEEHVKQVAHITTIAGYVQWKLTGRWTLGMCEASGMFPVDTELHNYDPQMIETFNNHITSHNFPWKIEDLLPEIIPAGESAGVLTEAGAGLIDPSGRLKPGISLCPPEGDAGTGMVATNSIRPRTGNVSAGTSVFAMLVLDKKLSSVHPEIDIVVTPDGNLVGMAHSNNCTSDFDAWIALIGEAAAALGKEVSDTELYGTLMPLALEGDADAGGLLSYGYVSGEHLTGFTEGRPLFVRTPDGAFSLANFVRAHLFSSLCALRTGLNVLTEGEGVKVEEIRGHGGFFKTPEVGQKIMAAATNTPVSVLDTAGEGGAWGMALLAAYSVRERREQDLAGYLDGIFAGSSGKAMPPQPDDVKGFEEYFKRYSAGLAIETAAVENLRP